MPISTEEICTSLANNILHLVLMPTEACNFRCTYCYEDFRYKRMEPEVVQGVKRFLSRRAPELDALTLSWFGGEPLLARDIMDDILLHAQTLGREHPGMHLVSDITTNAYLLSKPVLGRLLDLGVTQYQISFDGPREWHDRTRVLANGRGTFDRIWSNMLAMREEKRQFQVLVRLHVDRENQAAMPEFIEMYEKSFGGDPRFRLFLRNVSRLGGPNDARFPFLEKEEGRKVIEVLGRCAEEHRVSHLTVEHLNPICYATRGNSFVVRANGRLNKCTVALEHPNNQVGRIDADGHVELHDAMMLRWMRGLWSGVPEEFECPMHGYADPGTESAAAPSAPPAATRPEPLRLRIRGGRREVA